jgi:hypothetical protein
MDSFKLIAMLVCGISSAEGKKLYCCYIGKMAQGAGYLANKATQASSDLAQLMLNQGSSSGSTTTTVGPTTTMSVAEFNLRQQQLEADKQRVHY